MWKKVWEARGCLGAAKGIHVIPGVTQAGFVFGRKGLMAGATVEGARIGTSKRWRVIQVTARS